MLTTENRWQLAWSIAMLAAMVNSALTFLWEKRSRDWESAYWRDTQELREQLIQRNLLSKSKLPNQLADGSFDLGRLRGDALTPCLADQDDSPLRPYISDLCREGGGGFPKSIRDSGGDDPKAFHVSSWALFHYESAKTSESYLGRPQPITVSEGALELPQPIRPNTH